MRHLNAKILLLLGSALLGCSDSEEALGDEDPSASAEQRRPASCSLDGGLGLDAAVGAPDAGSGAGRAQDQRQFTMDPAALSAGFGALPGLETDRYTGVLEGAGYRIEIPKSWNGVLVMYAHGYVGATPALRVSSPSIRRYLLEHGYAWAASSYSKNYYDVRAGVEDTNKLALAFTRIARENGRTLSEPTKRYIIGHSMGGHVTGAAVERETLRTAQNKVRYDAAMPMCGVLGDVELFNYFTAYQAAAHTLTSTPMTESAAEFATVRPQLLEALFAPYPTATTPLGDQLKSIVRNLSGGARPGFDQGFATKSVQDPLWNLSFGGDGTLAGVLEREVTTNRSTVYQLDDDPALSQAERAFNARAVRVDGDPRANAPRRDGLRYVPAVNGEFDVPVLALHTLGDLFVPFKMEQIYRQRAIANGRAHKLVQWAIRGIGHCEFTLTEQERAFEALVDWEVKGQKPAGDEVLDRRVVADPSYGCRFTVNTLTPDEEASPTAASLKASRAQIPACPAR